MLELFDELGLIQRTSNELVVWSLLVMQLVTIGYPLTMFGQRVEPKGFRDWLIRRGLHLTCLCAAAAPAGETHSCRIVTAHDENVYAFCAHYPTRCNFFIHITAVFHSATLESHYHNLPTIKSGIVLSMDALRKRFTERVLEAPSVLNERCPYFEGYCGEHISQYPGITQSNGLIGIAVSSSRTIGATETNEGSKQTPLRTPRLYNSYGVRYNPKEKGKSAAKRYAEPSKSLSEASDPFAIMISECLAAAAMAGPSNSGGSGTSHTITAPGRLSNTDSTLLETLMRGDGISP